MTTALPMEQVQEYLVPIAVAVGCVVVATAAAFLTGSSAPVLDKKVKFLTVQEIEEVSHDTKRIRLKLPGSGILGLPVGKHMKFFCPNPSKGTWNGRKDDETEAEINRAYTPTTGDWNKGYVDFVIKVYRPGETKAADGNTIKWEDGGKMTLYLDKLKVGDKLKINGPFGLLEYKAEEGGALKAVGMSKPTKFAKVGMMAGGSGITPMLQVLQAAVRNPKDDTKYSLIYANKVEDDILCKDIIDDLITKFKGRLNVEYTLDFPPAKWSGSKGFISTDMIKEHLPGPASDTFMLMCGPPPMVKFACKANLEKLGYDPKLQAAF